MCQTQAAEQQQQTGGNAITANGESNEDVDEQDVIALALKAPPGATVDENYAAKQKTSSKGANGHTNGDSNGEHADEEGSESVNTAPVKLSAATIKKKKKKAAAKLRQEQEAAEAAAKAHALDPLGFFKNDKPSTPWYEEDDI